MEGHVAKKARISTPSVEPHGVQSTAPKSVVIHGLHYGNLPPAELSIGPSTLTQKELLERRLQMISALQALYKEEYGRLTQEAGSQKEGFAVEERQDAQNPEKAENFDEPRQTSGVGQLTGISSLGGSGVILEQGNVSSETLQAWKEDQRNKFKTMERLEQASSAMTGREMDRLDAIGCFCGKNKRFLVSKTAITIGRWTDANEVEVDLALEGDAKKISRLQAQFSLGLDGEFKLKNLGKRLIWVNNTQVETQCVANVPHLSLMDFGGIRLLFLLNHAAVERIMSRKLRIHS